MSNFRVHPGGNDAWVKLLPRKDRDGLPKPLFVNAEAALSESPEWRGVLAYDEFKMRVVTMAEPPWGTSLPAEWTDHHDRLALHWLQRNGIEVSESVAASAVQAAAFRNRIHPPREYLESLVWDGIRRADDWLTLYMGVKASDYTRAVAARWLISAVARIFRPGCKADCCLILEGPQDLGKSSALKIMGGQWFTDEIAELGTKDASFQLLGVWIVELGELSAMSRSEVAAIKAFMSRAVDRFRPPYGRRLIDAPRQVIFAGTVNPDSYLRDETGGRRFWPVRCTSARLAELRRDRDQLWAEAVERFRAGDRWWIDTPELRAAAELEQRARYEGDAWDEIVLPAIDGRLSVSISEILGEIVKKDKSQWTQADRLRVSRMLKSNGWERYNACEKGGSNWRYRRIDSPAPSSPSSLPSSSPSSLSLFES